REKVVGLVALALRSDEAERTDELRKKVELLEQLVIELAPTLVPREELMPVRGHEERVPPDDGGARPLRLPEAHEEVREPDEGVARLALGPPHRLRQCVVRAVGEGIAVDHEQRLHRSAPRRSISAISRSVASRAASEGSSPFRSSSGIGL